MNRLTIMLMLSLFLIGYTYISDAAPGSVKLNPHKDKSACDVCHTADIDKLNGWFVFGNIKKQMKSDLVATCTGCHTVTSTHGGAFLGSGSNHATGKAPTSNRRNLPLSVDGTVNCATTCHDIHTTGRDPYISTNYLRMSPNDLCVSCHDK